VVKTEWSGYEAGRGGYGKRANKGFSNVVMTAGRTSKDDNQRLDPKANRRVIARGLPATVTLKSQTA
jgi:hypothetical protein